MIEDTDHNMSGHEYHIQHYEHEPQTNDPEQLHALLQSRAAELFRLCDTEDKGFINKKDIQRMREPLGLTPDLLEEVFDTLDADKNGFLTLEEFTNGFSSYLGAQWDGGGSSANTSSSGHHIDHNDSIVSHSISSSSTGYGSAALTEEELENESLFRDTMESLGAASLIDGESNVKDLWLRLRHEDPNMQRTFEDFIGNVCQELRRSKSDFSALESALQSKSSTYDENVKKLYEEMEAQIKAEKNRILAQERMKERELKEKLEHDLKEKEKMLQDSLSRQVDMEQKLFKLNLLEYQQKQENERLLKEKQTLEEKLQESFKNLEESKSYINTLVEQTKQEKRNKARQSLRTTENIALERESLVKELEMLKEINKKLQDERDEIQLQTKNAIEKEKASKKAFNRPNSLQLEMVESPFNPIQMVEAYSEDDTPLPAGVNPSHYQHHRRHHRDHFDYDDVDEAEFEDGQTHQQLAATTKAASMRREQPIGANSVSQHSDILNVPPNATPQRVFKIVFIGDSGVGKTSFVQRFCNDTFRESFSTTIGVDFQVKSILIDNRVIALQLWDTAGQERYRSITKQYFRKADGVICMYDITSEQSFKNLRNWITSIKECASDECVLAVIGNKIDLCENDESRVVKYKDGANLADEHGALFFETSSKESKYVFETMEGIARILQEKEDKQIEDVLNLRMKEKKKGCCS